MQYRMKKHQLNEEQITELLTNAPVGNLATINENGYPYVVPVHFRKCEAFENRSFQCIKNFVFDSIF